MSVGVGVCVFGDVCMGFDVYIPPTYTKPPHLTKQHPHPTTTTTTPQLLCGEHSRATGARYGEQSRRAKGGNNKGSSKGASASASAAAKAKKSKRVVKRKVW